MSRRPPARQPRLAGYEFVRHLGSGGFADVFLYTDVRTSREVAVKVLLADSLSPGVRDQFESEARLMGQLSTHPSIVTVYNTGIAPDGRPYLVMEYCSEPSLGDRFRVRPLDIPRALELTVEICGAVETAHRAGILHRDIKPANILVSDYGKAMLTDFGISAALGAGGGGEFGLSVPWAPPEFVDGDPGGRESDVWSLAATLYSLLEGRAPFELPGQDRSAEAQMHRILHDPLPPMQAVGVPPVLEQTIAAAMVKDPRSRYATALEFGNALRRVQAALRLPESTLLVRTPRTAAQQQSREATDRADARGVADVDVDGTRMRTGPAARDSGSESGGTDPASRFVPGRLTAGSPMVDASDSATRSRLTPRSSGTHADRPGAGTRTGGDVPGQLPPGSRATVDARTTAALVAGVVIVAAVAGAFLSGGGGDTEPAAGTAVAGEAGPVPEPPPVRNRARVPAVTGASGAVVGGDAVFRWRNPDPQDGDSYLWTRTDTGTAEVPRETDRTEVTVAGSPGACISVSLVRADGRSSADAVEVCAR